MKIKVLGTRGEIEESCENVKNHSGILIDNILFDLGETVYLDLKPKAIFITHLHPDHYVKGVDTGIPIYSIERPEGAKVWNKLSKNKTVQIDNLKVTPIPTTHSKKVKSCAFLIEDSKRILYTADMIWINKRYHDKLKDLDLVITEASSFDRDLIRRDKETGEIYGHSSAKKLYELFNKLGAKKVMFVHYGKWFVDDPEEGEKKLKSLGDNVIVGRDDYTMSLELKPEDVEAITPKVFPEVKTALILVEPHGKWIFEGKKKAILKSRKFTEHIGESLLLIADKLAYGYIILKDPKEINEEQFKELMDKHCVSEEERSEWCKKEPSWCKFPLYYYEFDFTPFDKPKPIRLKVTGPQVFVSVENIEFLEVNRMTPVELEYYHTLAHSNIEEFGDPWCRLHYEVASEMLSRNFYHFHRGVCDRIIELDELIKEVGPSWVEEYIKRLPKYTRAQVGDDWRIVLGWYSSLKEGKKLFKKSKGEEKIPITEEDCKKLGLAIVKELIRRGATFNRPETYKKHARELFEWVIKQIGEENIPWKELELIKLPEGFTVQDIDLPFILKLSDKELEELWKWLHEKWKKEFPSGETPEDYVNANIFIQIERWKRGLIDYDYVDKDKLDKASRYAWQEYGGVTPLGEPEGETISLEDVINAFIDSGVIPVKGQPYAAYLCGRIVNEGRIPKDHDIDIIFRQNPDPRLIVALKKSLPEFLSKRIHVVFDPSGPGIGYSVPIYGYALNPLPRELMVKGFGPFRLEGLKTGKYIIGVKPKSGWQKWEFWDPKEAWQKWASKHIEHGIWIEEKVDGRRHQIHVMPDGKVKLFTEDTHRDRANIFPEIVSEFEKMNIPDSILDGEILAFTFPSGMEGKNARAKREIGELMPREDTAAITAAKSLPEDYRKKLVLVIYDIMKLKGKDLVDLPYSERRRIYSELVGNKYKYIDYVRGELAKNMQDYFRLVKKYRSVHGSEGVVAKDAHFKYPVKYSGENRSEDMMKIKNLKEIDVLVLGVKQKTVKATGEKLPTYMYECYIRIPESEVKNWYPEDIKEYNGKHYAKIGMSYGTNIKASIGDIVTVMPIRIRFYTKNGKRRVTWMFPYFKEKKPEKKDADPLEVAEKLAKLGTGPPPGLSWDEELEAYIRIELEKCPFYANFDICPLRKRFGIRRAIMNLAYVEEEVLKYPVMCPLAKIYKCPYIKDYYYGFIGYKYDPALSEDNYIDETVLPKWLVFELQGKYLEMPPGEHDFVMESHILTSEYVPGEKKVPSKGSQHMDWRMAVNGYLVGWSIVGGNVNKMITPKRLLDNINKGFRTETKARQPKVWLFKDKPIAKGEDWKAGDSVPEMYDVVVGEGEPRGKMFVMTRGKVIFGVQKPYFHEYFLKDDRYFKDWTRIIVRAIKGPKLEPETKEPIKGTTEMFWRTMIPGDQLPYAMSKRAMKKGYKPPKDNKYPFPKEWAKKKFPKEFEAYEEYLKTIKLEELSRIKYTLSVHSWRGPIHVRGMPIRTWYLFLDDKGSGSVRTFRLDDVPPFSTNILAWSEGRDSRKYLDWEGKTKPMSRFNPNKALEGEMKILDKGTVDYKTEKEEGIEKITLDFKGKIFSGKWTLIQEDPESDAYVLQKEGELSGTYEFVYHKHAVKSKDNYHYDLRIKKNSFLDEFNLYGDIRETPEVKAIRKTCHEPEEWFIKEGENVYRRVGPVDTWVTVIDHGKVQIIEDNPDFVSMKLNSKYFKNQLFVAKKELGKGWIFKKETGPVGLSTGNPLTGNPYKPYVIKEKSTWDHFDVYIYDPREFVRSEPQSKVKEYLKDINVPEGVTIYIGLYPVPGKIHHARVFMVRFKKDKWSHDEAVEWIKKNRLEQFQSEMIRERKSSSLSEIINERFEYEDKEDLQEKLNLILSKIEKFEKKEESELDRTLKEKKLKLIEKLLKEGNE